MGKTPARCSFTAFLSQVFSHFSQQLYYSFLRDFGSSVLTVASVVVCDICQHLFCRCGIEFPKKCCSPMTRFRSTSSCSRPHTMHGNQLGRCTCLTLPACLASF